MRRLRTTTLLGLLIGLLVALNGLVAPRSVAIGATTNGYVDFSFGTTAGTDPTGDKPQSKLWHHDGSWWGVLFNTGDGKYHIYRLSWPNQWVLTSTVVDDRPFARTDVMWDDSVQKLYVIAILSNVDTGQANQARLSRFSYNPGSATYSLDAGFPVIVMSGSTESITLDKDSTGKLWVTYTQNNQVYVSHSTTSDTAWRTPFLLPGATTLVADDISSLVAYKDQSGPAIGVLWSNHNTPSSMFFAYHRDSDADGVWQGPQAIYSATCAADDHINLKSLQADPSGAIFAAVKTSFGDKGCGGTSSSPLIRLVVRKPNNTWTVTTFGTVGNDHTRPILLLDTTNRQVHMFATSPTSCGYIYYKKTSMDNPSFDLTTKGTVFIGGSYPTGSFTCVNNATTTKQTVDANTGLVVLAGDESKRYYLHNAIDLGAPGPRLIFSASPSGAETGLPFATQPVVVAQSAPGVTNTAYNGPVTLAIKAGTGAAGATLAGTVTVNAVGGVATFGNLSLNKMGTNYKLTATAAGMSSGDSAAFDVTKRSQTISFAPLPDRRYGDAPFAVGATASSGLPVTFAANGDCTVSGGTVTIAGAGVCTVTASQAGSDLYDQALEVAQTFDIAKAAQTIVMRQLPPLGYGQQLSSLSAYATASSGLPITFAAGGSCQIVGDALIVEGYETCVVVASQPGDKNYNPAQDAFQSFVPSYARYVSFTVR